MTVTDSRRLAAIPAKLAALDLDGRPVELVSLASAGPVLVAFLRHYG